MYIESEDVLGFQVDNKTLCSECAEQYGKITSKMVITREDVKGSYVFCDDCEELMG